MFLATSKPPFFPLIFYSSALGFPSLPGGSSGGVRMELVRKLGRKCCVVQSVDKNRKLEVIEAGDNVVSGEDVFDQVSAGAKVPPDHLLIMVNGIIGSAADWRYAAKQFVKRLPDKVIVHCSDCNSATLTFDGVDRMGERLAEEVLTVVQRWPEVSKISFIAHSLGGLVARYAIGRLYENVPIRRSSNLLQNDSEQSLEQLFEAKIGGLQPVNFITVATPHLGSRGHRQLPFLCGLPFLERRAPQTAHWIVGRSGKHLFLTDNDNGGRPLLLQMVNDTENIKFMSALGSFKRRVAYANANFDQVVGWRTSSIRRQHELPKSNLLVKDEKYPHIMYVERETSDAIQNGISSVDIPQNLEEEMIRGLTQVPWERVDVSFHKSTQRYIAHTTIQVKNYWLNSDGADVVLHMIDNFLL
ncbi:putative alpha/Beta hydrolase [Helianthus annuus]|uniref:Alpha/Beta hydrolase n=1 Tax=Helianthus annuus TaxID=4232 RepID=A0A251V7C0_HELAN|nr:uncharacterized protein LOC110929137 [Helianthus annuus]XP_022027949.1 uncharacterized protein LOC110929137 [Helianthus annuus]XP_035843773.1 uncharacterized protein LOC110929137 [Helianthus annuus]KAF5813228.1 putative alpha/Beta hydrolase [Helianthus annuus]KAJ0592018.1 putative alpha/Beta hydrolase, lipase [Helianthus annuus]KAJ0599416.1 putative alpha/Beta hydrolase [Helianthus annuus]KAJ0606997.1 putative alpha/Beta hydrolase, lipase [Helianthus annuus]KAJ0767056.1 putative alpha/Bet